jgi:hypothetical protein
MATHKQKFLSQAYKWLGAKEQAGYKDSKNKVEKGSKLAEIFSAAGAKSGTAWCAIYVYACAKKAKATKCIGKSWTAGGICKLTVKSKGGTWIHGPARTKGKVVPRPGDLILFKGSKAMTYHSDGSVKAWHAGHVGIVYKITKTKVVTLEGNVHKKSAKCSHKLTSRSILGYARPKWSKIDTGLSGDDPIEEYDGPLYETENTRHDMTMREIGYMNTSNGKLTTSATKVPIALINYTTVLGDLYDLFERQTYDERTYNTNKLKGNEKIVVDDLITLGFSASVAAGIAGNIKIDSNYNPAASKDGGVGLALWKGTDATQMKDVVGMTSWVTDLSGQVEHIYNDIANEYPELYLDLSSKLNSPEDAERAATRYANTYRGIKDVGTRVAAAKEIYSKIVILPPKQSGTPPNPNTATPPNKAKTPPKYKVIDTSKKTQKLLPVCYMPYSSGANAAIKAEWTKLGSPSTKGIAYISGNYLVAVSAGTGCSIDDVIELRLTNGSKIPCLVAGVNTFAGTFLQFYQGGGSVNLTAWSGLKIKQIINYGKRKK